MVIRFSLAVASRKIGNSVFLDQFEGLFLINADWPPNVLLAGRLSTPAFVGIDQSIGRAVMLADGFLAW